MNKTIFLAAIVAFITSCGGNDKKTTETTDQTNSTQPTTDQTTQNKTTDVTKTADYQKGLDLITKSDCLTCHDINDKKIGPAYADVAKKYAGQPGIEDSLANKVIHGGSGNWGSVPMTPHPQLSHDDAKAMVTYVLTLNQQ